MVIFDLELSGYINAVTPGDFNNDAHCHPPPHPPPLSTVSLLDQLVTRTFHSQQYIEIYLQEKNSFNPSPHSVFSKTVGHPALLDINGDQNLDLVLNLRDDKGNVTAYVYEKQRLDQTFTPRPLSEYAFRSADHCLTSPNTRLKIPHSFAFVDLNGDCLADLFVTTEDAFGNEFFEIWLNMKNGEYCVAQISKAPSGAGQVTFADIDRNGVEDAVFSVCQGNNCMDRKEIRVVFNENNEVPECKFDNNYVSYKRFKMMDFGAEESSENGVVMQLQAGVTFALTDKDSPVTLRAGDFNLDGYPELLVTVDDGDGPFCGFFQNIPGNGVERRSFYLRQSEEFKKLKDTRGTLWCTFFDLDENGVLDLMLSVEDKNGEYSTLSFYNNFLEDAFRLKALMLSGSGGFSYSSTYSGPVFQLSSSQLDLSSVHLHATQLPLTAYFALNTPYCVFGIGRTISYIEKFHATVPTLAHSARMWSPVIPNSYLIISPKKTDVDGWRLILFEGLEEKMGWVMIGVTVFLAVVGAWAGVRLRREQIADKRAIIETLLASR